jgi:MFS family permease
VATVVMPAVSVEMIDLFGWRETYLWFGAGALALGLLASFFMVHSPAQMGLNPEGDRTPPPGHLEGVSVLDAVLSRPFILIFFAAVLLSFGLFIPFAHFLNYLTDIGIRGETAAQVFGTIGIGSILGRFLLSGLADRFGRRRSLAAMYLGITLIFFVWLLSENVWLLSAFGLIFGICYGGFVALAPAIAADYFGARKAATIIGILYTGPGLGNLVGPVLAGYAYDVSGSYTLPIIAAIVTSGLGTVLLFLLPNPADWRELARRSGLMLAS